jgi:gliding motility-associated-like protein
MKYLLQLCFILFLSVNLNAQVTCNGYWGPYLVNQTFGQGNATDNWYGPLATYAPGASTSTIFVGAAGPTGGTLADGYSGLTKNTSAPGTGQGANWISMTDHTGDPNGLMLLVNAPSTAATVFFEYTMVDLCPNTTLKLSTWVINVNSALVATSTCGANTQYPNLTLRVVDPVTNIVLATTNTGNVPIDTAWHEYSMIFNNGSNTSIKLQVVNNSVGSGCGNDLALDDITVSACIPYSNVLPHLDTLVCNNTSIDFTADVVNSPYSPAEYQWQTSNDGGTTWLNQGPPSTSPNFTFNTFAVIPGDYWIRFITGSVGTTGNINCTAISDTSIVRVDSVKITNQYEYICAGQSFDFFGQPLDSTGIYDTLIPAPSGRCDSLVRLHLTVVPRPETIMMLDTIIACQYDSIAIESNTLPPNPNYNYSWEPQTGLNVSNQPNVWLKATTSTRYILTVSNAQNTITCYNKDTIDILVNPGDFMIIPEQEFAICPHDSINFKVTGAANYAWYPHLYVGQSLVDGFMFYPETSINYRLIGTSDKGCRDTAYIDVTVHPAAVISLPDAVNIYPGERIAMEPMTNAVHFDWFPQSGIDDPKSSRPTLYPIVDTRYFVKASTVHGCTAEDSIDIWVKQTVIDIPNAFNPNETTFNLSRRGIASIELFEIYNRWGQKVFTTTSIDQGWDGKFNTVPQPVGAYFYQIKATTVEGQPFTKTGTVTLMR